MAYSCPRCGMPVKRGYNIGVHFGLIGMLLTHAFGPFKCQRCGKISRGEFSPIARNQMMLETIGYTIGTIVLIVVIMVIISMMGGRH